MEEKGTVSLWLGVANSVESLDAYLNARYSDDGDFEGSQFTRSFGIQYYDEDFKESEFVEKSNNIVSLLHGFSYAELIATRFEQIVGQELVDYVNAVVLLYNFNFNGSTVEAVSEEVSLKFIGAVRYE